MELVPPGDPMTNETCLNEWYLRDEILLVTQRWPVILFFCLAGNLIGLTFSLLWPSAYRATKELYVGLNIYRALEDRSVSEFAGLQFTSPDDYKNWQMANLNSLVFMDGITNETLSRVRDMDAYWSGIDQGNMVRMLHVYWRNAGKWRLVVENANPKFAAQAVTIWEDVVVEQVHEAIKNSQDAMILDIQLQSLTLTQAQVISNTAEMTQIRDSLKSWRDNISWQDIDLPPQEVERLLVLLLVDQANLRSLEPLLLDTFPSTQTPRRDYIDWLDKVLPLIDQEILILNAQSATLETQKKGIAAQYADVSQKSLGLSTNLQVQKITTTQPKVTRIQPIGLLVLIGGLLGLIAWAILWFLKISLQLRK